ncbi:MAG: DUF2520 domain-containing protein [Dehalococcoidia bacterium]
MAQQIRCFTSESRIAVVAAGRLGSSLAQALRVAHYPVVAISSRRSAHRDWLAGRLPAATVYETPAEAAARADIVFITAPDSAVAEVCAGIGWQPGQAAIHCAGVLPLSALGGAKSRGAVTGGLHPLQTFPSPDATSRLRGITFAVESADPDLSGWLADVAQALGGKPLEISGGQRAAYHASAVMSSGLLAGLIGLAAEMWQDLGVPRERALANLLPLIESTVSAVREQGIPSALTGPYVRGDAATVAKHLEATSARSPEMGVAYAALALAALPIAAEQGGLSPGDRAAIEKLLRERLREGI